MNESMTLKQGSLFVIPVAIYLGLYAFLLSMLKIETSWLGFVVIWYWGMENRAGFEVVYKKILPGALYGVLIAYVMHTLPIVLTGLLPILLIVALMIVTTILMFMKKCQGVINGATFLTLMILTIPMVAKELDFIDILLNIIITSLYIGISAYISTKFIKGKEKLETS